MLVFTSEFWGDPGAALVAVCVALFVAAVGGFEYRRRLKNDAHAIAVTYRAAISVTKNSLEFARTEFSEMQDGDLPPDAIYDFRKEDWFSVHNQLCGSMGKLLYANSEGGERAIETVSEFYEQFKASREVFAYVLTLQHAVAVLKKEGADEAEIASVAARLTERSEQMVKLIESAEKKAGEACKALDALTSN
ncbi:MAG: hypothetical protein AAFZ99_06620 [Pseudomonadota bacterium]